jgi:hypothetical protein
MIILDERNYLEKELTSKGFEVFDFYENHNVLSMETFCSLELKRRSEFLVVDTQTILNHPQLQEQFKIVLNTFLGAIFFNEHSNQGGHDWIKNEGAFLPKIIGEHSLPMDASGWTIFSNQLQFFWNLIEDQRKLQKHITQFSIELDQVLQNAHQDMIKAKKIHETLVPRRFEEIKGVSFTNKYAVGEGGGEFYDLIQTPGKIYQVFISSQSYLISSAILGLLAQQKDKSFRPEDFLKSALSEAEIINHSKKKSSEFDILIVELDLQTLTLTSHSESKVEFCSLIKGPFNLKNGTQYQIEKGEKVIVFSSGFLFNWREEYPGKDLFEFLETEKRLSTNELMSELFFRLKEGKDTNFLKRDATVVMIEVNRHGIHKV